MPTAHWKGRLQYDDGENECILRDFNQIYNKGNTA